MFKDISELFYFDPIAMIVTSLVIFLGSCVAAFAYRYLEGDRQYRPFFLHLLLLVFSVCLIVCADHIAVLLIGWSLSNFLISRLIIHKSNWKAAKYSGFLAAKNYLIGSFAVALALILLHIATGETSIKTLIKKDFTSPLLFPALCLLLIGAMTQSAIIPFHRWLISSLNAPTPVSAMMHAGIVNGGGVLLMRFTPLYLKSPNLLTVIFILGVATAFIGTLWKLIQNDIKRMLACSTVGQMGFMLAQCGLGLFPAALAHLVTHGMFKAYLFLASSGASQVQRDRPCTPPKALDFFSALSFGLMGSYIFTLTSGKPWLAKDTSFVLTVVAFLTASQFSLTILSQKARFKIPLALVTVCLASLFYGICVHLITKFTDPMHLEQPQPLSAIHLIGITFLILTWLAPLYFDKFMAKGLPERWIMKLYVVALNSSQPHPETVTSYRNGYKF